MMKLYTYRNSICCQKVYITLHIKGISHESQDIDLFTNEQFQPWYLKINPKGVVPALDHDGRIVTESTLICEYLDDSFPDRRLIPDDPLLRTVMRHWSKRVDEDLFEATREISFSAMFRENMRRMTAEQREGRFRNVGDPVKRDRLISTYEHGADSPYVYQGVAKFEAAFKALENDLRSYGGPWLLGDALTLADINMIPFVARIYFLNLLDIWTVDRPLTRAWLERARTLPSVQWAIEGKMPKSDLQAMHDFGTTIRDAITRHRDAYLKILENLKSTA